MDTFDFLTDEAVKVTLTFASLIELTATADILNAAGLNDSDLIETLLTRDKPLEVEWRIVGSKDRVPAA